MMLTSDLVFGVFEGMGMDENSALNERKKELEKELNQINIKRDNLKELNWIDKLVVQIVQEMVKHMWGMTYDYWEPHGIDNILTVFFFPKSTSTKNSEIINNRKSHHADKFCTG
jgi:hypothetical protein